MYDGGWQKVNLLHLPHYCYTSNWIKFFTSTTNINLWSEQQQQKKRKYVNGFDIKKGYLFMLSLVLIPISLFVQFVALKYALIKTEFLFLFLIFDET